jgi:hypothetical protein
MCNWSSCCKLVYNSYLNVWECVLNIVRTALCVCASCVACVAYATCAWNATYPRLHLLHAVHVCAHPVVLVLDGHAFEVLAPRHGLFSHHKPNNFNIEPKTQSRRTQQSILCTYHVNASPKRRRCKIMFTAHKLRNVCCISKAHFN